MSETEYKDLIDEVNDIDNLEDKITKLTIHIYHIEKILEGMGHKIN